MSQHDYDVANGSGAAVRADINNALGAIVTMNSGASAPSPTFAHMLWADTTAGIIKKRNAANSAWVNWFGVDASPGDTVGPGSSTNNNVPTFSGTTGKLLQDSGISGADLMRLSTAQAATAAKRAAVSSPAYSASLALDFATANDFIVGDLTGNITLSNPTNAVAGQGGSIVLKQDGTGGRTLTLGSNFKVPGGVAPTLSTGASKKDRLDYWCETSSIIHAQLTNDVA